ncbi:MAG: hypothetical protein A2889_10645 [Nitrospinae bacterium RIFCSPLOWO2_01_FULL_39_10]|nr:MAG: hypothetical protein A2889_10645 [Nitrospinae bacterium RIFCSPLOWO2_01_FULL_39_10]
MRALRYKNRAAVLSFTIFSLISLALLPFYHIHTEIEHVQFLDSHKHQAHQHICLIESFVSQLSGGSIDKDCEDSHEEEEAQTNKSQYVIKQGGDLTKDLTPPLLYTLNSIPVVSKNPFYFLSVISIYSHYSITPSSNNFSTRSPPQILI